MNHGLDYADLGHDLYVGTCPRGPEDVTHLARELGVQTVVNLQSDKDFSQLGIAWQFLWTALVRSGLEVIRVPIIDMDSSDLARNIDEAVRAVTTALDEGRKVYLHCNLGMNRSPSVAIAVLATHASMGNDAARAHVRSCRSIVPEKSVIRAWLEEHYPGALP